MQHDAHTLYVIQSSITDDDDDDDDDDDMQYGEHSGGGFLAFHWIGSRD